MSKFFVFTAVIALAFLTAACDFRRSMDLSDQDKASLAGCLTAKGAKLYVTSWCGACKRQKAMFGTAVAKLYVIQCDDPGTPGYDHPECRKNKIGYIPTWIFQDGRRLIGCQDFKTLAEYAGCRMP